MLTFVNIKLKMTARTNTPIMKIGLVSLYEPVYRFKLLNIQIDDCVLQLKLQRFYRTITDLTSLIIDIKNFQPSIITYFSDKGRYLFK